MERLLKTVKFVMLISIVTAEQDVFYINVSCSTNYQERTADCHTLDDCLRNSSFCFESNRVLQFEGGDHTVLIQSSPYLIQNKANLTLISRDKASINCERNASFAFLNVTSLCIQGLSFQKCGVSVGESILEQINETVHLPFDIKFQQKIGLLLVSVENLTIDKVVVTKSLGYGLVVVNPLGISTVERSVFELSNTDLLKMKSDDCTKPEMIAKCSGGNALIIFTDKQENYTLPKSNMKIIGTNISEGINLVKITSTSIGYDPVISNQLIAGGGISLLLLQRSYSVHFSLLNSSCHSNMGFTGANVYISLFSYVMSSNITFDRVTIRGGNGKQDLTMLKETSQGGGLYYEFGNRYQEENDTKLKWKNRAYYLTFTRLNVIKNSAFSGGGMFITLHLSPTNEFLMWHNMTIESCIFHSNKAFYGAGIYINQLQFLQIFHSSSVADIVFTSNISNIIIEHSTTLETEQRKVDMGIASVIFFNGVQTLKVKNVTVRENRKCTGMLLIDSIIVCDGIMLINNKNSEGNGGGAILIGQSYFILYPNSNFLIANNEAGDHGGGLYIPSIQPYNFQPPCFFQVLPKSFVSPNIAEIDQYNATFIFTNNTANDGLDIYGGDLENCYLLFWDIGTIDAYHAFVHVNKSVSSVTSYPRTLCFCDRKGKQDCSKTTINVNAYPGHFFNISVVPVGQLNGTTATDSIQIEYSESMKDNVNIKLDRNNDKLDKQCSNLSFQYEVKYSDYKKNHSVTFDLLIEGEILKYYWKTVTINLQPCPPFFFCSEKYNMCYCSCLGILKAFNIKCRTREAEVQRPVHVYIGYFNNCTYVYHYCPVDRCSENTTIISALDLNLDEQCVNNREGLMCGKCKPGYSRVFGSNRCKKCEDTYLLLLASFAVAGIIFVWALSYFNLTVSTGMFNGIIFYANIVKVNRDIFYPSLSKNNALTIFISWINLDLGIETCFFNGMNEFHKTLLQFAFPLYLWFLSLLSIYLSRQYRVVGRILGKHTTQALATIVLLSFTKLLITVTRVLSPMNLKRECENGEVESVIAWWPDATIPYFGIHHMILIVLATIVIVFGILPYTLLLTISPFLKRFNHLKIFRWVAHLKPFLDAYEGPYNASSQYWTGFLLMVRIGLFTAFMFNTLGIIQLQLFIITVTMVILLPIIGNGKGIYPSKWLNYSEVIAIGNLTVYSVIIQYLIGGFELTKGLKADVYVSYASISVAALQFSVIVLIQIARILIDACGISNERNFKNFISVLTMSLDKNRKKLGTHRLLSNNTISYNSFSNCSNAKTLATISDSSECPEEDLWTISVRGYRESLLDQTSN